MRKNIIKKDDMRILIHLRNNSRKNLNLIIKRPLIGITKVI